MDKSVTDWLLEEEDPGVRYLALRDLAGADGKKLKTARVKAHREGPISWVLAGMNEEGYWVKPGPGYSPKYTGTVWSIILLAQLGASVEEDERIATSCFYLLNNALSQGGQFSPNGQPEATFDCLQGNMLASLLDLGFYDPRLDGAFEWMARTLTGEGMSPMEDKTAPVRYYSNKYGPNFACGINNGLPCAWGGVKVMLAFSRLPEGRRTDLIDRAIKAGIDFFFSKDPATADYPCGYAEKPDSKWWKFHFPVFYVADILQIAEALTALGYSADPRLANTLDLIRRKQDETGRWPLEYDYRTWGDFGPKKQPNKWVTLRALRVLKRAEEKDEKGYSLIY